jgi:DNA-binding response OmpR family regulator
MDNISTIDPALYSRVMFPAEQNVRITFAQSRRSEATINGVRVRLAPKMFKVLEILLMRSGTGCPVSKSEIVEHVWDDPDLEPEWAERTVDVYVMRLRRMGVLITTRLRLGHCLHIEKAPEAMRLAA